MKRILTALLVAVAFFVTAASVPKPVLVFDTMTDLLLYPATTDQTIIILGGAAAFDSPPRVARHYKTLVYPIDNITVFPEIRGGEWYVTPLGGGGSSGGPVSSIAIACPDDNTSHTLRVVKVGAAYSFAIDQSSAVIYPQAVYVESSDSSSHRMTLVKDATTGYYSLALVQTDSVVLPTRLTLIASDTTEHTVGATNIGGTHAFTLIQ